MSKLPTITKATALQRCWTLREMFLEPFCKVFQATYISTCSVETCPKPKREVPPRNTTPPLPDSISDWFLGRNESSIERCFEKYSVAPDDPNALVEMLKTSVVEDGTEYVSFRKLCCVVL